MSQRPEEESDDSVKSNFTRRHTIAIEVAPRWNGFIIIEKEDLIAA
jgi:hypothetical protein